MGAASGAIVQISRAWPRLNKMAISMPTMSDNGQTQTPQAPSSGASYRIGLLIVPTLGAGRVQCSSVRMSPSIVFLRLLI
jgi:hypothetical protein